MLVEATVIFGTEGDVNSYLYLYQYWKAGTSLFLLNWLLIGGMGTGDTIIQQVNIDWFPLRCMPFDNYLSVPLGCPLQ